MTILMTYFINIYYHEQSAAVLMGVGAIYFDDKLRDFFFIFDIPNIYNIL